MSSRLVCVAATAAVLLATAGRVAAQPGNTPVDTAPPPAAPTAVPAGDTKSPSTALALSLGGTVASIALISLGEDDDSDGPSLLGTTGAFGIWLAPSFGHWYADAGWTTGIKWRLGGGAVAVVAAVWAVSCTSDDLASEGSNDCPAPMFLLAGGAAMFVGGTIHDIATAPRAARRYNERRRTELLGGLQVAPTFARDRAGFAVGGRF